MGSPEQIKVFIREFAYEDKHSMSAIENDVRTCGLLVNDYVNSGLMFAHKSFYDLLVAKFFLGKNLQKHDSARTISLALSTSAEYSPRLKNDYVIRKLLAELIASKISLYQSSANPEELCREIFEKCLKTMKQWSFRQTPERLFLKSLRQEASPIYEGRKNDRSTARRFLYLILLFFIICIIFIVRVSSIMIQHHDAAIQHFEELAPIVGSSGIAITRSPWHLQIIICGVFVLLFVLYLVLQAPASKADLTLLTWYYACLDNGVSEAVIMSCFTRKNAALFKQYLRGVNLSKLQAQIEKRRGILRVKERLLHKRNAQ